MTMDFTGIEFDDLIDEDPPPSTKRYPGSGTLHVEDKYEPLFTSATWTLTAEVRDIHGTAAWVHKSTPQPSAHTEAFTKRWVRQAIRQNRAKFERMGVDVVATYVHWDGDPEDLEETS